ncbi:MAG: Imm53 family immunity protein [Planctomycetaceae bacterium]|nr:Imm53 family immunity protein [Planctomycetaceae bacterium]
MLHFTNLMAWYQAQCNGSWEHHYGIKLQSLDNPGWQLTVDLIHTDLQGRRMADIAEGCGPDGHPRSPRWICCLVRENQFRGVCDPTQVERLLQAFDRFRTSGVAEPQ